MSLLLRNAIKSGCLVRVGHQNQRINSLFLHSSRAFSTETENPNQDSSNINSFLRNSSKGLYYGIVLGISNHTTRSDILNLLDGCNVTLDDLKVEYNRAYAPTGMMVQFPSKSDFDAAIRTIGRKGRLYRLERIDHSRWDLVAPFNGKALLLHGIARNTLPDDLERFLSGCQYDASSIQFMRQPVPLALVRFRSPTLAMHAFLTTNMRFCLNSQVLVRVLH